MLPTFDEVFKMNRLPRSLAETASLSLSPGGLQLMGEMMELADAPGRTYRVGTLCTSAALAQLLSQFPAALHARFPAHPALVESLLEGTKPKTAAVEGRQEKATAAQARDANAAKGAPHRQRNAGQPAPARSPHRSQTSTKSWSSSIVLRRGARG